MRSTKKEPELAVGWPISRVDNCLARADTDGLVSFVRSRYRDRFFGPISTIRTKDKRGNGFAMMALCSLLVETLHCYRAGLPTTFGGDYSTLDAMSPPAEYAVPKAERLKRGHEAFERFFQLAQNKTHFLDVDGKTFCSVIRNGLLHQAQTKQGWRIRTGEKVMWNPADKILDRNKFALALEAAFEAYLTELRIASWSDDIWLKARRKIWWLIQMSR